MGPHPMKSIRVQRQIDSETLQLPELRQFIGKTVEITVSESNSIRPVERKWQALIDAAGKDLVDPDLCKRYREFDRQQNDFAER
jgi:virulence-associated protein VagC